MIYADKSTKPKIVKRYFPSADELEEAWSYAQGRENRRSDDRHMNGY